MFGRLKFWGKKDSTEQITTAIKSIRDGISDMDIEKFQGIKNKLQNLCANIETKKTELEGSVNKTVNANTNSNVSSAGNNANNANVVGSNAKVIGSNDKVIGSNDKVIGSNDKVIGSNANVVSSNIGNVVNATTQQTGGKRKTKKRSRRSKSNRVSRVSRKSKRKGQLLGVDECTRGPSYWCASNKNARKCGGEKMVKYCKELRKTKKRKSSKTLKISKKNQKKKRSKQSRRSKKVSLSKRQIRFNIIAGYYKRKYQNSKAQKRRYRRKVNLKKYVKQKSKK